MNTFLTVQDVLVNAVKAHHLLYEHFDDLAESSSNERSRLMFKYMSEHEKRLEDQTKLIKKGVSAGALATWIQFTLEIPTSKLIDRLGLDANSGCDRIAEQGHVVDDYFSDVFGSLRDSSNSPEVSSVFSDLENLEALENKLLSRVVDSMM